MYSAHQDFSEDEIRQELEKLGYYNVSSQRLLEFKRDLDRLVSDSSRNTSVSPSVPSGYLSNHYSHQNQPGTNYLNVGAFSENYSKENQRDSDFKVEVTGVDPSMRRAQHYNTYMPMTVTASPKGSTSAPSSPTKSVASTDTDGEKRFVKRKVLRKLNGESFVDESIHESESDELSVMHVEDDSRFPEPERRPLTALGIPKEDNANYHSVIYPMEEHPHLKNIKRCDPVNRYFQYKESWESRKPPGEKQHKSLRWSVRENMLHHDEVVKKTQKVYVPNTYVIPTDKKRKSLRWQIRSDLAQGKMPSSGYHSD